MALRGNLKELSLPDIFQLVTFSGKTGVLRIHRADGANGSVWFRDGDVFFAQSNWRTEPLGERLVRAQRITPMALERALELRSEEATDGRRLGEILVEEGYITDKVLESFVQEQMQDTIFDLMRWDEGDFEFEAMPEAPEEDIGLAVSIENVIMEGSRRLDEWNRIKKKIPSTDIVFKMATAPGEGTFEISLKPIEWNLLLLVDGTRSVAELALETNRTDFEVARIVYGLFSAGLLEFAADDEVATARAERVEREAKLAEIEAERVAEEAKTLAAAEKVASQKAAAESAKKSEEDAGQKAATAKKTSRRAKPAAAAGEPAPVSNEPAEMPEFLGASRPTASADDLSVLDAAMGALLDAGPIAPSSPAPVEPTAAPYTPGEEPAFISASQGTDGDAAQPVPSVEELFADIAELAPAAEPVAEAPVVEAPAFLEPSQVVAIEPESAAEPEPFIPAEPEPFVAAEPEPEMVAVAEPLTVAEPEPQTAPEPEPAVAAEPALEFIPVVTAPAEAPDLPVALEAEPELASQPIAIEPPDFDFEADIMSVAASLDESEPAAEVMAVAEPASLADVVPAGEPAPTAEISPELQPGSFVVVPGPTEAPVEVASFEFVPDGGIVPAAEEPVAVEEPEPTLPAEWLAPEPEAPAVEAEPAAAAATVPAVTSSQPPGLQGFEHDLMALGLGELPAELRSAPSAPAPAAAHEEVLELEPVVEPMSIPPTAPAVVETAASEQAVAAEDETSTESAPEVADFSALLQSLDISADDAQVVVPTEAGQDPPADLSMDEIFGAGSAESAGVISTDAFLDNLAVEPDFRFQGELTDELSALTGADRPMRPSASVRQLPAEGEALLHRDSRVDRETLLKIIDGIKNL